MHQLRLILFPFMVLLWLWSPAAAQYQANNNAVQTSCNCYRLTNAANNQNGSVWNINLINLNNPFNFAFDVFLGCNNGGADGMAFVLQSLSVNAGSAGGGIGYQGINPSLAVEMDTYQNNTDPSYDHMALQTNGVVTHGGANTLAGPIQTSATNANVEDCAWHLLQVSWNPATQTFQVWFDGALRLTYVGNIINIFGGNPMVYWGFTAATGGANNLHEFCNTLNPSFNITPVTQCVGTPVQFNSTSIVSTGLITGSVWYFGDGATGSGANPTHTYTTAGSYTATLTITSEGCTQSFSQQVTINPAPVADAGVDVPICLGDGVQVTPANIDPTLSYSWSPATGVSNPNVPNPMMQPLVTTTYTLTVTTPSGCQASDAFTINVNPLPVANAGADQTSCSGSPVTLSASGGESYSWSPATGLSAPNSASTTATPSTTSVFTVTVTDANNCQATDDVTVTVSPLPNVNAGTDVTICAGQTTQLVGSGAVSYVWSPATGLSNAGIANPVFSGLTSSNFLLTGTDANGCINTAAVMVNVNSLPNVNAGADQSICIGDAATLGASGAVSYVWSPATGLDDATIAAPTYLGLVDAVLTVTGTDANGCVNTDQISVTVHPLPNVNAGNDAGFCLGTSIQLGASGASTYQWSPAADLNNPNVGNPVYSGSADVTLTVTGTDANGCANSDDVILSVIPLPVVNAGADASLCAGQTLQLNATGAQTYQWSPATGLSNASVASPVLTASVTTVFTVAGTDANGCTNTDDVEVTVFALPQAVINPIANACLGGASFFSESSIGNIVTYAWDFGDNTTAQTAIASRTYTAAASYAVSLTVTDNNGCQHSAASTAVVNPLPVVTMNIPNGPDFCEGEVISFQNTSPGNIAGVAWNFAFQQGLPAQPGYSSPANAPQFSYPTFGPYAVRLLVLSDLGCSNSTVQTVNIHDKPVADFSFSVACEKDPTAFLDLSSVEGNSLINGWQWNFGDGSAVNYLQNPVYLFASDATYQVQLIVQSDQGCRDTVYHDVWVNPTPEIFISGTDVCIGGQTQFFNASVPQDATVTSWSWNFGNGQTAQGIAATHDYSTHGDYTVTLIATTDSACTATGTTIARVFPNPVPQFTVLGAEGCEPHTVSFFNNSTVATGGLAAFTWNFGYGDDSDVASPTMTYADTVGTFDVTLTAVSNQGCVATLVESNAVTVHVTPVASYTQSVTKTTVDKPVVSFVNTSQDALIYSWDFGNGSYSSSTDPSATYLEPGQYEISLTVENGMCSHSTTSKLTVEPIFTFYIPSAFTPDANGKNEVFLGRGEGYTEYQMYIFNRWGEQIFFSGSDQLGWDGTHNGLPVQRGVYVYYFALRDWFGGLIEYEGGVTLLR
jgi:gliding motility-associated-like protein